MSKRINKAKKKNEIKSSKLSDETKNLIKTIIIVVVSFGICYLLFLLLGKIGMFEAGYEKPESEETKFTYNTAIIGTVFNRPEDTYYVAFDEEDGNVYFDTLLSSYAGKLKIYKVNMTLSINDKYKGSEGNYKAKTSSELSIVSPTLIKIKDGKIIKYLEELEKIEEELSN